MKRSRDALEFQRVATAPLWLLFVVGDSAGIVGAAPQTRLDLEARVVGAFPSPVNGMWDGGWHFPPWIARNNLALCLACARLHGSDRIDHELKEEPPALAIGGDGHCLWARLTWSKPA